MPISTKLNIINPSNLSVIKCVEQDTPEDARQKLENAYALFEQPKRWLALHERIVLLEKLMVLLKQNLPSLAEGIAQEGGKPFQDAKVEAARAIQGVKLAIHAISDDSGKVIPLGSEKSSANKMGLTQKFPRGVVLAFSAFNHPLNLIVHQIIPAFAAGCPCVVKPASDTPLSCLALVNAMHKVGIPQEYISAVVTTDLSLATELVESNKIAFFSFIGSARVGWMLRRKVADGVRCALEHGGIAPCFVTPSANLDMAVPQITKGSFYHAGQVCVSTQRIYVDNKIKDLFLEKLVRQVKSLKVGNATDERTDVGPLIRITEVDRVEQWVTEAINEGAECVIGGKKIGKNFYAPTVLVEPKAHSKVTLQEIFGPVVCVYGYDNLDEVVALSNDTPFAFQASIFTENLSDTTIFYNNINASAAMVNHHTAFRDDVMPFAGLKSSGLGVGGIPYTIEEMQYEKMLVQPR